MLSGPLQLPNGWSLVPPSTTGTTSMPASIIPAANTDPLPGLISAVLPLLLGGGAAASNPLVALAPTLISVLFNLGHALQTQTQANPPGSNPSLDQINQMFWSQVFGAFAPHAPASS